MRSSISYSRLRASWRYTRWVLLTAAVPALWACNNRTLVAPTPEVSKVESNIFPQAINRSIDILFEVDNSVSMQPEQANLVANFPVFINILKGLLGGLPDVHIGVITSDMGAGVAGASITGCGNPNNGVFVDKVSAATDPVCATALLNPGQHFIASTNAGAQNNFTGDISDVFRCIAQVGTTGCGFEDHLEAVRAALGDPAGDPGHDIPVRAIPPNNAGFLRSDAYLAVILITNEEECSSAPDTVLFDPNGATSYGPLQDRCFAHTDVCDGQRVINYVLAGQPAGPFQNCVPDDTTFGTDPRNGAIPVPFYIDYIKKLKPNLSQILTSGIIAPGTPYALVQVPDVSNGGMMIAQADSCTGAAGVFGQPTPRLIEFFGAFGDHAITTSICDQSFSSAMTLIANQLSRLIGSPCITGTVLNVMGPKGSRADCSVIDHSTNAQGAAIDSPLASCVDNGNQAPCWTLVPGGTQCPGQQLMQFTRPANQAPATNLNSTVSCSIAP
jgi:hypothetical protein